MNSHAVQFLAGERIDTMLVYARRDRFARRARSRRSVSTLSSTARSLEVLAGAIKASITFARRSGVSTRPEGSYSR